MIGNRYWSTGSTVEFAEHVGTSNGVPRDGWAAGLDFLDDGFNSDDPARRSISTEGTLRTRYYVSDADVSGLSIALDVLIADAKRLGIEFSGGIGEKPSIYYPRDGEDEERPPPEGWPDLLKAEAERLGWQTYERDLSKASAVTP